MDDPQTAVTEAILARSPREKRMHRNLGSRDISDPAHVQLNPANIVELAKEIERTRDPRRKAILLQEMIKLRMMMQQLGSAQNIEQPLPEGMTNPVFEMPPGGMGGSAPRTTY